MSIIHSEGNAIRMNGATNHFEDSETLLYCLQYQPSAIGLEKKSENEIIKHIEK